MTIQTAHNWGDKTCHNFTAQKNGELSGGDFNYFLHGTLKKKLKIDPFINVDFPEDGKLLLHINMVSQGAFLIIKVDGEIAHYETLPAGKGKGPWTSSRWLKTHNIYQCVYDKTVSINIPKGKHKIQLLNNGKDWIGIDEIKLTNYIDKSFPDIRSYAIKIGKDLVVWIQDKKYNWKNLKRTDFLMDIKNVTIGVPTEKEGTYALTWWDTHKGKVISKEKIDSSNHILQIKVPRFNKDIACKIRAFKVH